MSELAREPNALPPFGDISSGRVRLRPVAWSDVDHLMPINGDPEVTHFLPYDTWLSAKDAAGWLTRMEKLAATGTGQQLVVLRRADDAIIGTALVFRFDAGSRRAEIGYVLGRAHWGQGIMHEALSTLLTHAFSTMGLRRIEAEVNPENLASNRLLERLGFVREGTLRQRWIGKHGAHDTHMYGMLADQWHARRAS